MLNTANSR